MILLLSLGFMAWEKLLHNFSLKPKKAFGENKKLLEVLNGLIVNLATDFVNLRNFWKPLKFLWKN